MRSHYAYATALCLYLALFLVGCSSGKEDRPEGLKLLEVNGCTACHSIDGTQKIGPTLKGLYGKEIVVITQGTKHTIKADRDYLERSILDPRADVVEGFKPTMPGNFKNQLGDKDLNSILDYLESIGHN